MRQPSIGIRRVPSSGSLRQQAAASASANQLSQSTSRLPALDETCALGEVPTNASASSASTIPDEEQPGRLRRASLAFQSALGLKKESSSTGPVDPTGTAVFNEPQREYAANMVDVLDTVGM